MSAVEARFWAKVERGPGCWLWRGCIVRGGYGQAFDGEQLTGAHRLAWRFEHGDVPPGMHVLHRCDVPACVRVDHLFLGTHADNMADKKRKGRVYRPHRPGEANPVHRLSEADVRAIRARRATGETLKSIGATYHLDASSVRKIALRLLWRHVA